jgi:nicotinamidase-related amidase
MINKFAPQTPRPLQFGARDFNARDAAQLRRELQNGQVMFWDVDTQIGFMDPIKTVNTRNGEKRVGLYVTDAVDIKPNLKTLTDLHYNFRLPRVASMDSHDKNDPEFRHFTAVSDEHCVKRNPIDWQKIRETLTEGPRRYMSVSQRKKDVPTIQALRDLFSKGGSVILEKNTISAFQHRVGTTAETEQFNDNWKTKLLVERLKAMGPHAGIRTAVVYGVATDFCVKAAVEGLKANGIRPIVVKDAIKGVFTNDVNDRNNAALYEAYKGVPMVSTADLKATIEGALASRAAG